jgi:hypothetical protein
MKSKSTLVFTFLLGWLCSFCLVAVYAQTQPLKKKPTDTELLQLADQMIKTPIKKRISAQGEEFLQRDMNAYLRKTVFSTEKPTGDDFGHDHKDAQLLIALNRFQPSVKTYQKYFTEAGKEFKVPVELLMAIGQVQSNWTQVSESMYGSWGVMGIIENKFIQQITEAAAILKVSPQQIKDDAKTNIRAAAALLAKYQLNKDPQKLEDWFDAAKEITGLQQEIYKESLAKRFFDVISQGSKSVTLWGEIINLPPANVNIDNLLKETNKPLQEVEKENTKLKGRSSDNRESATLAATATDYPGAIANFTTCNYSSRNGATIGYYFVHYIATGTYEGAISWFHNCSSQVSAHYVVRNSDGQVTQVVREYDKAWSQGVAFYNERGVGTEHEVLASNLSMWYSDPMMTSAGNLARNVCDRRGIPKLRKVAAPGINGHSDVYNTSCPNMTQAVWNLFMSKVNSTGTPVAPVAVNDAASTNQGQSKAISVLTNDTDANGDATINHASVVIVSAPTNGTASVSTTGVVTYTPNSGFTGNDSLSYTVKDNTNLVSNAAKVSISVASTAGLVYQIDINHTNSVTKPGWTGLVGTEGKSLVTNGATFTMFGGIDGTRDRATAGEVTRDFAFHDGISAAVGFRMTNLPTGTYNVSTWHYDPGYPGLINVEFREEGNTATTQIMATDHSLTDATPSTFQIVVEAGKNYEIVVRENSVEDRSRFNGITLTLASAANPAMVTRTSSNPKNVLQSAETNTVKVYSNPVTNELQLELRSKKAGVSMIRVYDLKGRQVSETKLNVEAGKNAVKLNVRNWFTGLYIIQLNMPDGQNVQTKILKQ